MSFNLMKKWEEAKKRADAIVKDEIVQPVESKPKLKKRRFYNIHKRSLPVGLDKIVVFNIESYHEAVNLIDKATDRWGKRVFSEKVFYNDENRNKTVIYYDVVAADATPQEKSVFYNPPETVKPVEWVG